MAQDVLSPAAVSRYMPYYERTLKRHCRCAVRSVLSKVEPLKSEDDAVRDAEAKSMMASAERLDAPDDVVIPQHKWMINPLSKFKARWDFALLFLVHQRPPTSPRSVMRLS